MVTARAFRQEATIGLPVDDLACHMGAVDGYGGTAPGSEHCPETEFEPYHAGREKRKIVDFHVDIHGGFWVCFEDQCRRGSYDEALYVMGGGREIEG